MNQFESNSIPADNNALLYKWFGHLVQLQIFRILIIVLSAIPAANFLSSWLGRLASALSIFILLRLSAANQRYRKAALFLGIYLAGNLMGAVARSNAFSMLFSICSVIAMYQEYWGHSEICVSKDYPLSEKWHSLFWWQMGIGLISSFLMAAGVVIGVLAGVEETVLTNLMVALIAIISIVLELVALGLLKKTRGLCQ